MKEQSITKRSGLSGMGRTMVLAASLIMAAYAGAQAQQKPNILVIWGDDIGTLVILDFRCGSHTSQITDHKSPITDQGRGD